MSDVVLSPNMSLPVPIVGVDPGPQWATDINACLGILDQHDHSSGSGVQITPSGLNISTDLPINQNNLTSVKTVNFTAQLTSLPGLAPNLGCVYVAGNELYYNDEVGNVVQITNTGSVNAGAGSITGLPSGTASASYSSGSGTFIWQSATNTGANMDGASFIVREKVANAKGITLSSPTSLAADYTLILPTGLPGQQNFMTLDSSGNIAASWNVDNSTIEIASNNLQIKDHGVTQVKLASRTTGSTVAAGGVAVSSSSGAYSTTSNINQPVTNLSVTITTTGRPVQILLQSDNAESFIQANNTTGGSVGLLGTQVRVHNGASVLSVQDFGEQRSFASGDRITIPVSVINYLDLTVNGSPGTYTYTILMSNTGTASTTSTMNEAILIAYEI